MFNTLSPHIDAESCPREIDIWQMTQINVNEKILYFFKV